MKTSLVIARAGYRVDPGRLAGAMPDRLALLRSRTPRMLDQLGALVSIESPSADTAAGAACARAVGDIGRQLLGADAGVVETADGDTHLRWRFATPTRV